MPPIFTRLGSGALSDLANTTGASGTVRVQWDSAAPSLDEVYSSAAEVSDLSFCLNGGRWGVVVPAGISEGFFRPDPGAVPYCVFGDRTAGGTTFYAFWEAASRSWVRTALDTSGGAFPALAWGGRFWVTDELEFGLPRMVVAQVNFRRDAIDIFEIAMETSGTRAGYFAGAVVRSTVAITLPKGHTELTNPVVAVDADRVAHLAFQSRAVDSFGDPTASTVWYLDSPSAGDWDGARAREVSDPDESEFPTLAVSGPNTNAAEPVVLLAWKSIPSFATRNPITSILYVIAPRSSFDAAAPPFAPLGTGPTTRDPSAWANDEGDFFLGFTYVPATNAEIWISALRWADSGGDAAMSTPTRLSENDGTDWDGDSAEPTNFVNGHASSRYSFAAWEEGRANADSMRRIDGSVTPFQGVGGLTYSSGNTTWSGWNDDFNRLLPDAEYADSRGQFPTVWIIDDRVYIFWVRGLPGEVASIRYAEGTIADLSPWRFQGLPR